MYETLKLMIPCLGDYVEHLEISCITVGNGKCSNHFEKYFKFLIKFSLHSAYDSAIPVYPR